MESSRVTLLSFGSSIPADFDQCFQAFGRVSCTMSGNSLTIAFFFTTMFFLKSGDPVGTFQMANVRLHRSHAQAVRRVKRFESGIVYNPITLTPDQTLADAKALIDRYTQPRIVGHGGAAGGRPG